MDKTKLIAGILAISAILTGCTDKKEPDNVSTSGSSSTSSSSSSSAISSTTLSSSSTTPSSTSSSTSTSSSVPETTSLESSSPREDELLTAKAKASYERLKDKVILDEAGYIKEYTRLANQGFEEEEIEQNILAEYGKREEPKPTQSSTKPTQSSTKPTQSSTKPTESKPTQSSTSTRPPQKFTGTLQKPSEQYPGEVKVIGERETGVSIINREVSGYMVETPGGKFWFCEQDGSYYRSMSDKLTRKWAVDDTDVFPNRDYSKWDNIRLS